MHPSFESLIITSTPSIYAYLMDIHHNTSLRSILENDSIFSTSIAHICSCSGKGARLWLVTKPSIYSFCIAHSTFTAMFCFCLGLIQPLTFSLLMCECERELDASNAHLTCCPFGGQQIATHDAIQDVMYALA